MRKKLISLLVCGVMMLQMLPVVGAASAEATLSVTDFQLQSQLVTTEIQELYGDATQEVTHTDIPDSGYQYLLVYLTATVATGATVDLDSIVFTLGGTSYARVIDDSFLENHSFATLRHGSTTATSSGWVVYQVPSALTESQVTASGMVTLGTASCDFYQASLESDPYLVEQTNYYGYPARQAELEESYLAIYEGGSYTAQNPYIIVNPYEIAPLSALILFETETAVSVTTTIQGKTAETTIVNTVSEATTDHQIPLIGLYQGENQVTLTLSDGTSYSYTVTTAVNSSLPNITVTELDLTQLSDGLYYMKNEIQTLVDVNGDIRGYFTVATNASGLVEITEDGHFFTALNSYTTYGTILEMDYMGYVYREIQIPQTETDHDAYLIDDTTLLLEDGTLDLDTMEFTPYAVSWDEIFNSTQGSFEVRDNGSIDWLHFNTITDGGEGYILVSMRNQHAVAKLSYPEMEVQWILSVNDDCYVGDGDVLLTPTGSDFEWFYSQHDIHLIGENGDGTIDVAIFDNGLHRGLSTTAYYDEDEMYSRMVVYRIDESAMTAEQIWTWGEELGTDGLSYIYGSARYLEETDTYLGNFDALSATSNGGLSVARTPSKSVEVNAQGEVVLMLESDTASYRTMKVTTDQLYSAWQGLGQGDGQFAFVDGDYTENPNLTYSSTAAQGQILSLSATQNALTISGWVASSASLSQWVSARYLVISDDSGNSWQYFLTQSDIQIKNAAVSAADQAALTPTAGFYEKMLDISFLADGYYTLSLVALVNGSYQQVDTGYTLRVGDGIASVPVEESDRIADQNAITAQMVATFEAGSYTLQNPYVVVDAYGLSPLSAIALFDTDKPSTISVEVVGLHGGTTLNNDYTDWDTHHEIAILGLYSQEATQVTLTAHYADGTQESKTLSLTGGALPEDFSPISVEVANTDEMAYGLTVYNTVSPCAAMHAVDWNGDVRFVLNSTEMGTDGATEYLDDGTFLILSDRKEQGTSSKIHRDSLYKMDFTGKIYGEYYVISAHHDYTQLENGNVLVAAGDLDGIIQEESHYEIDLATGEIVTMWDFDAYFPVDYYDSDGNRTASTAITTAVTAYQDWYHTNSVAQNPETLDLLFSGRNQDAVLNIDYVTGELNYIIGDHRLSLPELLQDKLLTPIDGDGNLLDTQEKLDQAAADGVFEWQFGQHDASFLPNGDIILFDNGNVRGAKDEADQVDATTSYSRVVIYRVDQENMTIQQIWQYGRELGSEMLSTYVSGVQYLGEDHYLINFGGIVKEADGSATYHIGSGATGGSTNAIQIELKDGEIVFQSTTGEENSLTQNVFRAERVDLYFYQGETQLTATAQRLGEMYSRDYVQVDYLPTGTETLTVLQSSVVDTGTQMVVEFQLSGIAASDDVSLFYVGDSATYSAPLTSGTGAWGRINHVELPLGDYDLYLVSGSKIADLNLSWTNSWEAAALPDKLAVTIDYDDTMGVAQGAGVDYFAGTPLTVLARPDEGYIFGGWKVDGVILSMDTTYSFTPQADVALTAVFAPDDGTYNPFNDVAVDSWYHDAVVWSYNSGLYNGTTYSTFSPDSDMTRAMFATVLYRLSGDDFTVEEMDFADVADSWYSQGVSWGVEAGIVTGTSATTFEPDAAITREAVATMLYRYEQSQGGGFTGSWAFYLDVADAADISEWAWEAMCWCYMNGILTGHEDGSLDPSGQATRAQVATMLLRYQQLQES